ncbi:cytochrome o ubiquinol oxidase subunit IV [Trinickia terrae]|uniref:Cytochrome bo(3) ubiquinol oxidase subunit 4 n=1 Tax=Trinickia terrae TaxID=2571161 RepID=A0A4V5PI31_9BURK|nr:cytochrome o ubiquinol oxidase subunit IV [Trinickia terrae]TKC85860.1 cytochrome o ubiquinol oxidase subunit IV [Trinickia terrae]
MSQAHTIQAEAGHGSKRGYVIGFVLSVILTVAAFGLVIGGVWAPGPSMIVLAVLAFVQILVHLVCFLHMGVKSSQQRWDSLAFGYTVLCVLFLIVGTVWVMHNVAMNMMAR